MADHFAQPAASAVAAARHGFEVRLTWTDGLVVLSVCDAVDVLTAPQLSKVICDALGQSPFGMIVDLTDVEFLACIGMSVLVAAQEAADAISVQFGVVADGVATSRPIRLLGLDATLKLYPTLDHAIRDFNEAPAVGGIAETPSRSPSYLPRGVVRPPRG
jgi:anti-sigma B factor antagonist